VVAKIGERLKSIEKNARDFLQWSRGNSKILIATSTAVMPSLIGIWAKLGDKVGNDWLYYLGILALAAVQVYLFIRTMKVPEVAIDTYFVAREIEQHQEEQREIAAEMETDLNRFAIADAIAYLWSALQCEQVPACVDQMSDTELSTNVGKVLDPVIAQAEDLFEIENRELWSFSLFRYVPEKDLLVPCWRAAHRNHPRYGKPGRAWKPGHGHVGLAFIRNQTIFTANANDEDVRRLTEPQGPEARNYDAATYVSFAAVPINALGLKAGNKPCGVLVATSNQQDRFHEGNVWILEHAALVLANLFSEYHIDARDSGGAGDGAPHPTKPETE
jgi:hypothetical protein